MTWRGPRGRKAPACWCSLVCSDRLGGRGKGHSCVIAEDEQCQCPRRGLGEVPGGGEAGFAHQKKTGFLVAAARKNVRMWR